jgi:hypothetical protein
MRLHSYRDDSRSRHFDLIDGGSHAWSIDLVSVTASGMVVVGDRRLQQCREIATHGSAVSEHVFGLRRAEEEAAITGGRDCDAR